MTFDFGSMVVILKNVTTIQVSVSEESSNDYSEADIKKIRENVEAGNSLSSYKFYITINGITTHIGTDAKELLDLYDTFMDALKLEQLDL